MAHLHSLTRHSFLKVLGNVVSLSYTPSLRIGIFVVVVVVIDNFPPP